MSDTEKTVSICPATGKALKVTVVGDRTVGKTCLLGTHTKGTFPTEYVTPVLDIINHNEKVDDITYCLTIWDTHVQEEYDRLGPLSYPGTSVFIVCFSLKSRASFENIADKWLPELRTYCPKVPVLLVGTKKDVRDESVISQEDGLRLSQKEGLVQYLECSAKTQEGVAEVFQVAAQVAAQAATGLFKKKSQMCCIL